MQHKILIINDDKDMADVLEMIFIHQGYQVEVCETMSNMGFFFLKQKPDLVIIGFLDQYLHAIKILDQLMGNLPVKELPLIILSLQQDDLSYPAALNVCAVDPLNFYLLSNQVKSMLRVMA